MGRHKIVIPWSEIDKLCALHCTHDEIAGFVKIHLDTIRSACQREMKKDFSTYYEEKASPARASLRRKQYEMAMRGDRVMLIWLGKQWLGQSEKVEERHIGTQVLQLVDKLKDGKVSGTEGFSKSNS